MRLLALSLAAALFVSPALAQSFDSSTSLTGGGVALSDVVPLSEAIAPAVGSSNMAMRADARLPRITRAQTVLVGANGVFSGTWASPLSVAPMLVLTPVLAGSAAVSCKLTEAPTTTTFAGLCKTEQGTLLNLTILGSGLTVAPFANSVNGMAVQVIAIPPTQ